jgi:hypothetical protein
MKFDFTNVDDVQSFVSVPPGRHVCRVTEVRPGVARDGSTRWTFRLEVVGGVHHGRTAAWDSLTWSDRGVARVRHVLKGLGVSTQGVVEIEPQDLVGRRAEVQVQLEERENPQTGRREMRTRVPYAGYEPIDDGHADDASSHAQSDAAPSIDAHETRSPRSAPFAPQMDEDGPARRSSAFAGHDLSRFLSNSSVEDDEAELEAELGAHLAQGNPESSPACTGGRAYAPADLGGPVQRGLAHLVSESATSVGASDEQAWGCAARSGADDLEAALVDDRAGWNQDPALCAPAPGDPLDGSGSRSADLGPAQGGSGSTAGADGIAPPVKRGPGRPRKHPLPPGQVPAPTKSSPAGDATKRRGRKPKNQDMA